MNLHKTAGVRDLGPVDVGALRAAVLGIPPDGWDRPDDFEANYNKRGALRQAAHVVFLFSDRRGSPIRYFELPIWGAWAPLLQPVLDEAVAPFGYATSFFPRVMLARLSPGSFIRPHIDGGWIPHKIHVPLQTNEDTFFFLEDERHHFEVGRAYEVNNGARHSVVNAGEVDRIHLIFEYLDAGLQAFE